MMEIRAADLRFTQDGPYVFSIASWNWILTPGRCRSGGKAAPGLGGGPSVGGVVGPRCREELKEQSAILLIRSVAAISLFWTYLVEEVLAGQSEQTRQFLIATSVLHQLTGELCDRLTGRNDGNATLQALDRGNVFVVPLDEQRQWYRYHHLFADASGASSIRISKPGPRSACRRGCLVRRARNAQRGTDSCGG